jgi:predicted membrane protein
MVIPLRTYTLLTLACYIPWYRSSQISILLWRSDEINNLVHFTLCFITANHITELYSALCAFTAKRHVEVGAA